MLKVNTPAVNSFCGRLGMTRSTKFSNFSVIRMGATNVLKHRSTPFPSTVTSLRYFVHSIRHLSRTKLRWRRRRWLWGAPWQGGKPPATKPLAAKHWGPLARTLPVASLWPRQGSIPVRQGPLRSSWPLRNSSRNRSSWPRRRLKKPSPGKFRVN